MKTPEVTLLAQLCGIDIYDGIQGGNDILNYKVIHEKYKLDSELLEIMYNYGYISHLHFEVRKAKKAEFDKIDDNYSTATEQFEVLKTLLFDKDINIDIKGVTTTHKLRNPSVLYHSVIDTTITNIIKQLDSERNLQIDDDDIVYMLSNFDFFNHWLNKNQKITNIQTLVEKFKIEHGIKPIVNKEDISLEFIDTMLYIINSHNKRLTGNEKKRINPINGDDYAKNAMQSHCHAIIQKITLLLRMQEFLHSKSIHDILDVTLTNKHCEFIYDYLNFFDIYYFEKEKSSQDKTFTSSKSKLIRSCYKSFFSSKANEIPQEHIVPIINGINKYKKGREI